MRMEKSMKEELLINIKGMDQTENSTIQMEINMKVSGSTIKDKGRENYTLHLEECLMENLRTTRSIVEN